MSEINSLIHTNAVMAFQQGEKTERNRIINLLTELETALDVIRPESYKKVADMADLRIRTIRKMIELIKGEQK